MLENIKAIENRLDGKSQIKARILEIITEKGGKRISSRQISPIIRKEFPEIDQVYQNAKSRGYSGPMYNPLTKYFDDLINDGDLVGENHGEWFYSLNYDKLALN